MWGDVYMSITVVIHLFWGPVIDGNARALTRPVGRTERQAISMGITVTNIHRGVGF